MGKAMVGENVEYNAFKKMIEVKMRIPPVKNLLDLSGKVALVTGSGRGIGAAIARRLAEAGADVVVHYQHSEAGAAQVARDICSLGRRCLALQADLTQEMQAEQLVKETAASLGHLDILVNNAGVYPTHPFIEMRLADWQQVVDATLTSAFLCTRAAVRAMIQQGEGGVVINISSIEAANPAAGHAHYGAAKAGMEQFSRTIAGELGAHGIRVNSVSPGLIWSPDLEKNWPQGVQRWMAKAPLGRLGQPEDVADACLFLASPAARWISGANLLVDGGVMTCQVY
jgi:NAD(P)-dependent dehydrogenase (short-subunit alcohol dehydrogenase family)